MNISSEEAVTAKCKTREDAIPAAWKLDPKLLQSLAAPLETAKNNLIELDLIRKSEILNEKEVDITEKYNVTQLLEALASGKLTSVEVTTAFAKRAALAHQLVSLLDKAQSDASNDLL